MLIEIVIGSKWQHLNSRVYKVIHIANQASTNPDYPVTIVYIGDDGLVWCKPLENFICKMQRVPDDTKLGTQAPGLG